MDILPPITKIYSLVIQKEKQREVGFTSIPDIYTATFMSKKLGPSRLNLGRQQGRRDKLLCMHCGMTNHTLYKCYKDTWISLKF